MPGEEDRRRLQHLDQRQPRLELLARLRVKRGQACGAGDDVGDSAASIWQPLQTPSAKVSARPKKVSNCSASCGLNSDRARPALAGAERVAVAEAAAGDEALELRPGATRPDCRSVMWTS